MTNFENLSIYRSCHNIFDTIKKNQVPTSVNY